MSDWEESEPKRKTKKLLTKWGFMFDPVYWEIAGTGFWFWCAVLIPLGIIFRSVWNYAILIIVSYILVDYVMDGFLKFEDGKAVSPVLKRKLTPRSAYALFVGLILASAIIADQFGGGIMSASYHLLGSILTVVVLSIVVSGLLSRNLLKSYGRGPEFQTGDQSESQESQRDSHPESGEEPQHQQGTK